MVTLAPSARNPRATAKPIPCDPPVTSTRRPAKPSSIARLPLPIAARGLYRIFAPPNIAGDGVERRSHREPAQGRRNFRRLRHPERQCPAADGGDARGRHALRADRARGLGRLRRGRDRARHRPAGPLHRDARAGRHQPHDRHRLRLSRPLALDRHHLQRAGGAARPPRANAHRPSRADAADHQGDSGAPRREHRRDRGRGGPSCADRAARPGPSRFARGRGAGIGHRAALFHRGTRAARGGKRRRRAGGRRSHKTRSQTHRRHRRRRDAARRLGRAAPLRRAPPYAVCHDRDGEGDDRRRSPVVARAASSGRGARCSAVS